MPATKLTDSVMATETLLMSLTAAVLLVLDFN